MEANLQDRVLTLEKHGGMNRREEKGIVGSWNGQCAHIFFSLLLFIYVTLCWSSFLSGTGKISYSLLVNAEISPDEVVLNVCNGIVITSS